jgi:hypothetical protein
VKDRETTVKCSTYRDVVEFNVFYGDSRHDVDYWVNVNTRDGDCRMACLTETEMLELRDNILKVLPLTAEAPKKKRKAPHGPQEYKGNGKHEWEDVTGCTMRLRVPGGWLYSCGDSSTFVPVPEAVGYAV